MIDSTIKLISRLPMRMLYAFATGVYFLAFYAIRYRRRVICEQLAKVFPDAGDAERETIHRQFLKNFCDVIVEILKTASIADTAMRARVRFEDRRAAQRFLDAGQSILFVTSHMCNWEWLLQGVTLQLGYPVDAAYKPIRDRLGERLMLALRSRFGARLVPAKDLLTDHLRRRAVVRALAVNADQTPAADEKHQWIRFLGQDTAFYTGAEQIARATRLPVLYLAMHRARRGHYDVHVKLLWDGRETTLPGEITERYARACEADVLASPADWLWSYRRWRLKKPLYGST